MSTLLWAAWAVVVIGGLISATILTLIVLPTLYVMFERRYHHGHGERPGHAPAGHA